MKQNFEIKKMFQPELNGLNNQPDIFTEWKRIKKTVNKSCRKTW